MLRYVVLVNWTASGLEKFADNQKKLRAAADKLEELGGKVEVIGHCLGEIDLIATVDVETGQDVAAFVIALGSVGTVRTKTLQVFTEDQMGEILTKSGPLAQAYIRGGDAPGQ
jgi:uncharacterized protein with GYD domain